MIGIDFQTRRRNRANGTIASSDATSLQINVSESFGNCPKYINVRTARVSSPDSVPPYGDSDPVPFDPAARDLIAAADTFFIATSAGNRAHGAVDVSHRGGTPGFVKIDGDTLICPDYRGNRYYNTLGNLLLEPRAALLFVDFAQGQLLQIQGRVAIQWQAEVSTAFPEAERLWRMRIERVMRPSGARLVVV
jgi:predicted pyridoxine 5'-phosphate oxidase superfamily flavin-nucleotide-binding protein